ncbi:hypothetical protein C5167_020570 [Papaver somniferum]|uniref:Uncharacterized protein n=1 Tax=Papaver somniferum TaxID=3469 RepID=A0A4Y7ITE4_PAPSO|nr:hypothetical protein C5167_020570 [Papaver somniferum]
MKSEGKSEKVELWSAIAGGENFIDDSCVDPSDCYGMLNYLFPLLLGLKKSMMKWKGSSKVEVEKRRKLRSLLRNWV